MLTVLRQYRDSWAVKAVLLAIALSFIIFYGSETLRQASSGVMGSPASVNGVAVSSAKAAFILADQLDGMRDKFKGEVPENFQTMIRQNVVNALIHNELIHQEATRLGFAADDEDLKENILANPQFIQDGRFSNEFYKEKFLPWYQQTRGISYEGDLRRELAAQTLMEAFAEVFNPSATELKRRLKIGSTKYKFSVIKIKTKGVEKDDILPKDIDMTKPETFKPDDAAARQAQADEIYAAWRSGQNIDDKLKDNKLSIKATAELTPAKLKSVFDGAETVKNLKTLTQLTAESPFPEKYFTEGNYHYLVRLDEVKLPPDEPDADTTEELKTSYRSDLSGMLQSAWLKALKDGAVIEYSP